MKPGRGAVCRRSAPPPSSAKPKEGSLHQTALRLHLPEHLFLFWVGGGVKREESERGGGTRGSHSGFQPSLGPR